jgi:hypothetical protein
VPIKDFDYLTYEKVNFILFRIGVDIVDADIPVILLKDLGDLKPYALFITSVGSKRKLLI